jgi:hypothetical protein
MWHHFDAPDRTGHFTLGLQIPAILWCKMQLSFQEIVCKAMLFVFKSKCLRFLPYPRTTCLCKHPVRLNRRFLIPLTRIFRTTLYIWCTMLHCCHWFSSLSAFSTASSVMAGSNVWLNSANLIVQNLRGEKCLWLGFFEENCSYHSRKLFTTLCWWCSEINIFDFFCIQGLHVFASALSDFRRPAARLRDPIARSPISDIRIHFIYLTCQTALLWVILPLSAALSSIMSYGPSKCVIELDKFERSNFWDSRSVNISISSKKIAVILPGNHLQDPIICFES